LTAVLLIELLRKNSLRPVVSFSFRGLAPLFDLAPFRIVCAGEDGQMSLEAQAPDGVVAMSARAELMPL